MRAEPDPAGRPTDGDPAGRLPGSVYAELDARLGPVDARLRRRAVGPGDGRQPVHTVYVPADRFRTGLARQWGDAALAALREHAPPPYPQSLHQRVVGKLRREPIEDLRIDFEDGYGTRTDEEEDAAVRAVAAALRQEASVPGALPPFLGLRIKSLEESTRPRAVRTLDLFLDAYGAPPPPGFLLTLPKVSAPEQVEAMVLVCRRLEQAYRLPTGRLRFELQVETPLAVFGTDGTATPRRLIAAAQGRCVGLHYGTYDYSAAFGIAPDQQSLAHPVADFAKAVMQVAAAGSPVRVVDGATNVLPVGEPAVVRAAWAVHLRLVRRSLRRGLYQGWDVHPAQLPTRFAATYGFFRTGGAVAVRRLRGYLRRRSDGALEEPATARALAGFLLRGLDCGALDPEEVGFSRDTLAAVAVTG